MVPSKVLRNLIYHVTPMGNYEWNLEQISSRMHLFNGKKIAFVTEGKGIDPIEKVEKLLPGVQLFAKPNHRELRETATFIELLQLVKSTKANEITFYAHTKGVTRFADKAVKLWTEGLYHYNLDFITDVEERIFSWYPVVGAFKRYGKFGHFPKDSKWHYSGTFFWVRNSSLFNKEWKKLHKTRYGTEAYLSLLYPSTEAGCIFGDDIGDLYDLRYIKQVLGKQEAKVNSV